MRHSFLNLSLLAAVALTACQSGPYQQDGQQVTVPLQIADASQPRLVRLEVLGEKLIRVSATPEDRFADPQSLVILPQDGPKTPYTVSVEGELVKVATSAVTATVSTRTGRVQFADAEGRPILSELAEGAKTFMPYEAHQDASGTAAVGDAAGYSFHLQFDSPADEAFYGLGQHQADDWNYKGKNEELYQYNTKISVPFIVSNKGYGLYVDSYSLCRWGNPADYLQLNRVFRLYDKNGREGALTGTYSEEGREVLVRREDSIYFENLRTTPNLPLREVNLGRADVVYEGEIETVETGEYRFLLYYAGYMKVYVGGKLVQPEIWRTAWNPNSAKFQVSLEAGRRVPLRIEWHPDGGESYCGLRAMLPVDDEVQQRQSWWSELTPQMDYYFIAGQDADDVIHGYRTLTGKAQVMPRWAMGFWQSRERYKTQDELLQTVAEFRRRGLPLDNIVQDWSYWPVESWGSHEFDAKRFPDPQAMVDSVHAMHATFMISVWPKFYVTTEHFKELDAAGWMYQQSVRDSLVDWIWPGYRYGFYDAYSEGARRLFWQQMQEHLYGLGIDAWWMDASEPNVRDCTDLPYRKALCGPTALGPSDQYFNTYALMNAKAIYEGQRSVDPDRRVFLLTRSGFAGLQRYSTASWSGDIGTRWEDLKTQISAGLNYSISGVPYWTMDIGGFSVERRYEAAQRLYDQTGRENADLTEWRELQTRWYQFGTFAPLYRAHGQFPLREVWNIAPEQHPAYRSILYYSQLRYRLMPYLYSLAGAVHFRDYTIMRPLVMDFAHDARALAVGDQYLFGPALMVSPVYRYGDRSRLVYFPPTEGGWYDFYTGRHIEGGVQQPVEAPYERMPLHVRAGSILPFGPALQWADQRPADVIRLYVYRGADGDFTLYEDEDTNYGYERGRYATISFHYDNEARTLSVADREGEFPGMLRERKFVVIPVSATEPQGYDPEAQGIMVKYDGTAQTIKL